MADLPVNALIVASAVAVGMVLALLGSVKLQLARRPDRGDGQVRLLLSVLNVLLIPLMLLAGVLVDFWGVRPMLITGSVILALSLLALGAGIGYHRTVVAVVFAALGASALNVATIVLLPQGLFGVSEVAASLQMGLVFVALGALITPPLLDVLLHSIGPRRTMALLAFLLLMPAVLAAIPRSDSFPVVESSTRVSDLVLAPGVWAAGVVFFVYAPLEAFVSVWTTTYLTSLGQPQRQTRWLACFWGAMLISRLLFGVVLHVSTLGDNYLGWFLFLPALLSAVILGNMSGTTNHERALWGLTMLGLFLGPLFPMLLGMVFKIDGVRGASGTAYGLLFAFGSVGSLLLSPLVRLSANARTIQAALRVPLVIALFLAATSVVFAFLVSRD